MRRSAGWLAAALALPVALLAAAGAAQAQRAVPVTIGPGRIVCNGVFCELGVGDLPKQRYRVIVSRLPEEEIHRLRKCTGVAKPCIVTVDGIEDGDQMKILANRITWQD
ncbi:MAG: hypothetical protein ACJ8AI_17865 [Rhodopila sp.]